MPSIIDCKFIRGEPLKELKQEATMNNQFVTPIWHSYECGDVKFGEYAQTNKKQRYFVCIDDDKICAVMRITNHPNHIENGKLGYYVRPSKRGLGYAKMMIAFAMEIAIKEKIDLTAVVSQDNAASIGALKASNWIETGNIYNWNGGRKGVEFKPYF